MRARHCLVQTVTQLVDSTRALGETEITTDEAVSIMEIIKESAR